MSKVALVDLATIFKKAYDLKKLKEYAPCKKFALLVPVDVWEALL